MGHKVRLSVRSLVEFVLRCGSIDSRFQGMDRAAEGSRIHRRLQKAAGGDYRAEVSFKAERTVNDITYALLGRADGIFTENGETIIDEIKTTAAPKEVLTADYNPLHWAQAQFYGAFLCESAGLAHICVQITYYQIDTDEIIRHRKAFLGAELEAFVTQTLRKYEPWALFERAWHETRAQSAEMLRFPFTSYRAGQYELARAVYKSIASESRLAGVAPTGIGKTMSTIFPSIKALGEGKAERIFYLTAKTITRKAAEEALALLRGGEQPAQPIAPLRIKSLTLTAKDKICFLEERECIPQACPYANGYYDRINTAMLRFLQENDVFTKENISAFAIENRLCPFELALDLSLWCDIIICDYNYLFDPLVRLQRFFDRERGEYIFLIDEAHNLSERARAMYSAKLSKTDFFAVKKALGTKKGKLIACLTKINAAWIAIRKQANGAHELVQKEPDKELLKLLMQFNTVCAEWLDENKAHALHHTVLALYFETLFFMRIYELYGENYITLIAVNSSDVYINLLCLDAAPFIDEALQLGKASVLFSATLSPLAYFKNTLGLGECKRIILNSPFASENLCLMAAAHISTKYADRADTLDEVCALIACATAAKQGNYIVFLPSYKYMADITARFCQLYPAVKTHIQESKMDEASRDAFLAVFDAQNAETLVGFCVLGGIFSEGIDLAGERLIGSIIVGVGLPQISTEQNALKDYYEHSLGDGFAYAYQYPGFNKVLQAAGRVIRTPQDKGMVLLIDSRYTAARYRALFPAHWQHCQTVHCQEDVNATLRAFWAENDA
ncbi:MAG: ATP-dependent DNA helicase [Oscillospiraceae bacterium]|nr:ATP-dependent DNA helicase [Oscillospiraceae bacterium]